MNQEYKGYFLVESKRHGKCVKGRKKSTSIQIRKYNIDGSYLLKKQISYEKNNKEAQLKAIEKAKNLIDEWLDEFKTDFYCGNFQSGINRCDEQCASCADSV